MVKITAYDAHDLRFPTSLTGDGADAMNNAPDYSSAYITLYTDSELMGHGLAFTIGRGTDIVIAAMRQIADRVLGMDIEDMFADMGKTWDHLSGDSQLRWIGPEKGVIHLAVGAVDNALWDMFARSRAKPLWKLIVDMSPETLVRSATWRYLSDALTKEEAVSLLKAKEPGKSVREAIVKESGYPAYVTSAGWLSYSDAQVAQLTQDAVDCGFTHFKMKVGLDVESDLRRGRIIRGIIDQAADAEGKRRDSVLMIDANQVWDVDQAVAYVSRLAELRPWFIEEPTAPDDVLGHAAIRRALKPYGIGVATGEHGHNRVLFKQFMQADAIDVCQIDACRLAGVSEVLSVLLMAAKFGVPVCPHAGGVGLCEYTTHLSLIDYIAISGTMEGRVLEYVSHLHEHFVYPSAINERARFVVPQDSRGGYSIQMKKTSIEEFEWPNGRYWAGTRSRA